VSLTSAYPYQGPPFAYNDQYTGADGWPDTGYYWRGDTNYYAWATDGTNYATWNDGDGPTSSGFSGCSSNIGVATIASNLQSALYTNCMSSMGTLGETNTGGWTDGYTWKSAGITYINDGSTPTGLYWSVFRDLDSSPYTKANGSIMYSADGGTTWCAPGHSGGTCNTNGDAPAANTAEFTSLPVLYFVQYEQGSSGTLTVDCQNSYIYAYGLDGALSANYLMRADRGTNLQTASNWQYYSGVIGGNACTSGNWSSSFSRATQFAPTAWSGLSPAVVYVSGYGYVSGSITISGATGSVFYTATSITGPWTQIYVETVPLYSFVAPILSTLQSSGGTYTMYVGFSGNAIYDNGGVSAYSPHFRLMTITP
jgi:hypothetical protein